MRLLIALLCLFSTAADQQIDPKIYAKMFMNNKPLFDHMAKAVAEHLPGRSGPGSGSGKVLDLGSGPGEPTVTLAKLAPDSHIVCTERQGKSLAQAKSRAEAAGLTNVEFTTTSADDLSHWPDQTFDAVMMSLVLMFVPDKAKALKEVARVLKPGGMAYTAVWKDLEFYDLCHDAVASVAKKTIPDFAINPMKLSAASAVEDLAKAAGMQIKEEVFITYPFKMGSFKEVSDGCSLLAGPMLKQMEEEGKTNAMSEFTEALLKIVLENRYNASGTEFVVPRNSPQILTLRKPLNEEL